MVNQITSGSEVLEPDPQEAPPVTHTEHEKKFLPSATFPLPKLSAGTNILQFYFPAENMVISGHDLFYATGKKPFLTLSDADLAVVKLFLSASKPPKARIRLTEYKNQYQAFFNMKLNPRHLNGQPLEPSKSSALPSDGQTVLRNLEFECPMPYATAERLYQSVGGATHRVIAKTRYLIHHNFQRDGQLYTPYSKPFEIDIFHGPNHFTPSDRKIADNSGLKMIELEFRDGEIFDRSLAPQWLGEDVTQDRRFTNCKLSQNPYSKWPAKDQPAVLRNLRRKESESTFTT